MNPNPDAVREKVQAGLVMDITEALVGCIAGAVLVSETERIAREAGLSEIRLKQTPGYVESLVEGHDPLYERIVAFLPPGKTPGDYITSLEITAHKPAVGANLAATGATDSRPCCCSTTQ